MGHREVRYLTNSSYKIVQNFTFAYELVMPK